MFGLHVDNDVHLSMPLDGHARPLFELIDQERDRIQEWIDVSGIRSVDDQAAVLACARQAFAQGRRYPFVIEVDGDVAGTVDVFVAPGRDHVAEIGYMVGQRFEGRGIVTRAVGAVIDAAIVRIGLRRFEIRCAPENARSCAVPRRLGFQEEALMRMAARIGDRYVDEVLFVQLADERVPR
jgi:ribosomal-protein-serine acetyltransferase